MGPDPTGEVCRDTKVNTILHLNLWSINNSSSFESMRSTPRKTITLINKWQGPTTTTVSQSTISEKKRPNLQAFNIFQLDLINFAKSIINKLLTQSAPRTVSYSPVTKPSAIRSFPETFPGTSRSKNVHTLSLTTAY